MTAAWRPRAPLPRAAPRAAPALAPRARELWRSPAREDGPRSARRLAQSPQTPPALPRCARPGGRRGRGRLRSPPPPPPPSPGSGRPRGGDCSSGKPGGDCRETRSPPAGAQAAATVRQQALSPERVRGSRTGSGMGGGGARRWPGPGSALRSGGSAQPASALAAAKAHRCSGEGVLGGGALAAPPPTVADSLSAGGRPNSFTRELRKRPSRYRVSENCAGWPPAAPC